jgi:hypothetical protein
MYLCFKCRVGSSVSESEFKVPQLENCRMIETQNQKRSRVSLGFFLRQPWLVTVLEGYHGGFRYLNDVAVEMWAKILRTVGTLAAE